DLQGLVAFDFELPRRELGADAFGRKRTFAGDPRSFHGLLCFDFSLLDGAHLLDLQRASALIGSDAFDVDGGGLGDAGPFGRLSRRDLGLLDRPRPLDLASAGLFLVRDTCIGHGAILLNTRLLDGFTSGNLRLFGLGLAQRAFARYFGTLQRTAHLDIALLLKAGGLTLALDLERLALGIKVAAANLDHRVLFDVVTQLALGLD